MGNLLAVRRGLAILLCAGLAACSSGGQNSLSSALLSKVTSRFKDNSDAPKPQQRAPLTRAAVNASGASLIRARLVQEQGRTILSGAAQNSGYVTFVSPLGQSLTLRGSLITASRGLGYDLLSVGTRGNDPVANPTRPANWPASITRSYTFPGTGPSGNTVVFTCNFARQKQRNIEIVEVVHRGVEITETCANNSMRFENVHFADVKTGFVWRSLQWLGPEQGVIDLEIIEPLT